MEIEIIKKDNIILYLKIDIIGLSYNFKDIYGFYTIIKKDNNRPEIKDIKLSLNLEQIEREIQMQINKLINKGEKDD